MLAADLGDLGLFLHIKRCLTEMTMRMRRREIAFGIGSAIDQGNDVICLPRFPDLDLQFAYVALATVSVIDALTNAGWGFRVVTFADPLFDCARHHQTPNSLASTPAMPQASSIASAASIAPLHTSRK